MISGLKGGAQKNILDVLDFMSKKEMAEMAHALVEFTSKKRRFSTDQETVGGPIDVAVITRNEGLVWIQRKHYFDRELNPNFVSRVAASFRTDPKRRTNASTKRKPAASTKKPKAAPAKRRTL